MNDGLVIPITDNNYPYCGRQTARDCRSESKLWECICTRMSVWESVSVCVRVWVSVSVCVCVSMCVWVVEVGVFEQGFWSSVRTRVRVILRLRTRVLGLLKLRFVVSDDLDQVCRDACVSACVLVCVWEIVSVGRTGMCVFDRGGRLKRGERARAREGANEK